MSISSSGLTGRACAFCKTKWLYNPNNEQGAMAYATAHSAQDHPVEFSTALVDKAPEAIINECDRFVRENRFVEVNAHIQDEPEWKVYVVLQNE